MYKKRAVADAASPKRSITCQTSLFLGEDRRSRRTRGFSLVGRDIAGFSAGNSDRGQRGGCSAFVRAATLPSRTIGIRKGLARGSVVIWGAVGGVSRASPLPSNKKQAQKGVGWDTIQRQWAMGMSPLPTQETTLLCVSL